jgi:plastocyanin
MQSSVKILTNKKILLITLSCVILLIAVGSFAFSHNPKDKSNNINTPDPKKVSEDINTQPQKPPPLMNNQKEQLANGTSTATKEKTFFVTAGNYYFVPNNITVNQGDKISILFNNMFGYHNFLIPDFHIRTPITQAGQSFTTTFTVDKPGSYEFYSNAAQDHQKGMKGTLVVQ